MIGSAPSFKAMQYPGLIISYTILKHVNAHVYQQVIVAMPLQVEY